MVTNGWDDVELLAALRQALSSRDAIPPEFVAAGKNADFLILDANPLDNIANTRRISRVYLRGGEVDRAALRTQLNAGSAAATRLPTTD